MHCACTQATPAPKYWEGADTMGLYWALSNDSGLTWGPTVLLQPPINNLPLWGPMLFAQVLPRLCGPVQTLASATFHGGLLLYKSIWLRSILRATADATTRPARRTARHSWSSRGRRPTSAGIRRRWARCGRPAATT